MSQFELPGWAKLPRAHLLHENHFRGLGLRGAAALNALKLYLALVTFRPNQSRHVLLSYDRIEHYTGIPRPRIRHAIDVLLNHDWISIGTHGVASIAAEVNEHRKPTNVYILRGDFWGRPQQTYPRAAVAVEPPFYACRPAWPCGRHGPAGGKLCWSQARADQQRGVGACKRRLSSWCRPQAPLDWLRVRLPPDLLKDFFAVNRDVLRCLGADSHLVAFHAEHDHGDVGADVNGLANPSRQNEHRLTSLNRSVTPDRAGEDCRPMACHAEINRWPHRWKFID